MSLYLSRFHGSSRIFYPPRMLKLQVSCTRTFILPATPKLGHCPKRRFFHRGPVSRYDAASKLIDEFKSLMTFSKASHEISELPRLLGNEQVPVILHGYLGPRVNLSRSMSFVSLVDKEMRYSVQVVSSISLDSVNSRSVHEKLKAIETHAPVVLRGLLKPRKTVEGRDIDSSERINTVEVVVEDVERLNFWPSDIIAKPETVFPPERRHLQLRTERSLRDALTFRAKVMAACRDELGKNQQFTEIETPLLFKSTSEGAREFVVPTRRRGLAYALPQSPQQYKQLLMAGGISRYYQIARCFRDEDLRADRQPEFTQLDIEMSFVTGEDVMKCIETLIRKIWKDLLNVSLPEPFPRMTYEKAMSQYGSDKPDIRIGMPITQVSSLLSQDLTRNLTPIAHPIIESFLFPASAAFKSSPSATRNFVSDFFDSPSAQPFLANSSGKPGILIFDPSQPLQGFSSLGFEVASSITSTMSLLPGDLLVLQARPNIPFSDGSTPIGNLRLALHNAAVQHSSLPPPTGFAPLWVTDFPLFTPVDTPTPSSTLSSSTPLPTTAATDIHPPSQDQPLTSTHHPFTAPKTPHDASLLLSNPSLAKADHYDLVLNGIELGGGSRRIHHAALQTFVLQDILKLPPARLAEFDHLVQALRAGCPPHAGIALGFDRLVAAMLGKSSVRDVMAFPKSRKGEDACVGAPGVVGDDEWAVYGLRMVRGK